MAVKVRGLSPKESEGITWKPKREHRDKQRTNLGLELAVRIIEDGGDVLLSDKDHIGEANSLISTLRSRFDGGIQATLIKGDKARELGVEGGLAFAVRKK